jgi:chemotaxis protein MotB
VSELLDIEEAEDDFPSAPFWMVTFSDMVTLLLTFFVLIVSMSEVEVRRFKEALSHFNGNRNTLKWESMIPPVRPQVDSEELLKEQASRYEELLMYLQANDLQDKVVATLSKDGLHVSINDSVMFQSGRADLLPPAQVILRLVSNVLGGAAESVVVDGHTDDRPIRTSMFPSNWELSAARAASVVRFFLDEDIDLDPTRYKAVGFGEFHPVASNETAAGRSRNRRVEILFSGKNANKN